MTVKEFHDSLPSTSQRILESINATIMDNKWDSIGTPTLQALSGEMFMFNYDKELNPVVERYLDFNNLTVPQLVTTQFAAFNMFMFVKYQDKWTKLYDNIFAQTYNSIWNVDASTSIIHSFEHGKTTTETRNMTDTYNKGTTETSTITSDITQNSRNGFNSASAVDTDKSSRTGSSNVAGSGYDSNEATGTDTFTNSGSDTETTTETRGGNIGVTTTQSMLTQEFEFRKIFNYFDIVIKDIINELALNIYI